MKLTSKFHPYDQPRDSLDNDRHRDDEENLLPSQDAVELIHELLAITPANFEEDEDEVEVASTGDDSVDRREQRKAVRMEQRRICQSLLQILQRANENERSNRKRGRVMIVQKEGTVRMLVIQV